MYPENKAFKNVPLHRHRSESYNSSPITFDLFSLIENMKQEKAWIMGELNSQILINSRTKKIILSILHQGTEINSFQANDSITFQVLEGKLNFHIRKESFILGKGELLTLNKKIKYSFNSIEETAFLLTALDNRNGGT